MSVNETSMSDVRLSLYTSKMELSGLKFQSKKPVYLDYVKEDNEYDWICTKKKDKFI